MRGTGRQGGGVVTGPPMLRLAQNERADALLASQPFALLVGMLLDQQIPMEWAFTGPATIADRLGLDTLDPRAVARCDPETFVAMMTGPPAVHRYPRSMGERVQRLAAFVVDRYGGDVSRLWTEPTSGADLLRRLQELPGFGEQKARIFVALLGKQLGVRPEGWREAAGPYGEEGSHRSIADVVDAESLAAVRAFKRGSKQG
ncbi:MAG: Fe-S cluster assembly protein HesB [Jiangellaceae bacterium]|nr:Fe-S cluster assembly protein HesB [Jiangellaceae bacterium]